MSEAEPRDRSLRAIIMFVLIPPPSPKNRQFLGLGGGILCKSANITLVPGVYTPRYQLSPLRGLFRFPWAILAHESSEIMLLLTEFGRLRFLGLGGGILCKRANITLVPGVYTPRSGVWATPFRLKHCAKCLISVNSWTVKKRQDDASTPALRNLR